MKELEIAKEYLKEFKRAIDPIIFSEKIGTHLQTCKRWLEFLTGINCYDFIYSYEASKIKNKISELEETIKFYEEKGIK